MSNAKNWIFTLNNYDDDEVAALSTKPDGVRYIVFGKEVGESGTPHLQGFISFDKKQRIRKVKSVVGERAHLDVARDPAAAVSYCKKDGDYFETGIPPLAKGQRCDLESFKNAVKAGETSLKRLRENFSEVCAKYPRFVCNYIDDQVDAAPVPDHELYGWQLNLKIELETEPDDRKIIFCVDLEGNQGKTWFAKKWCQDHDDSMMIESGKKADMAFSIRTNIRYLFVNCTREQSDYLNYSFLESVKDGLVFSPKYESRVRYLNKLHVVVMMNQRPDMNKLSLDRYVIIDLD